MLHFHGLPHKTRISGCNISFVFTLHCLRCSLIVCIMCYVFVVSNISYVFPSCFTMLRIGFVFDYTYNGVFEAFIDLSNLSHPQHTLFNALEVTPVVSGEHIALLRTYDWVQAEMTMISEPSVPISYIRHTTFTR